MWNFRMALIVKACYGIAVLPTTNITSPRPAWVMRSPWPKSFWKGGAGRSIPICWSRDLPIRWNSQDVFVPCFANWIMSSKMFDSAFNWLKFTHPTALWGDTNPRGILVINQLGDWVGCSSTHRPSICWRCVIFHWLIHHWGIHWHTTPIPAGGHNFQFHAPEFRVVQCSSVVYPAICRCKGIVLISTNVLYTKQQKGPNRLPGIPSRGFFRKYL